MLPNESDAWHMPHAACSGFSVSPSLCSFFAEEFPKLSTYLYGDYGPYLINDYIKLYYVLLEMKSQQYSIYQ